MNKDIKKIFVVLAFYALSGGIFYNFQELWMAHNNLSTQTIGIVFSLCALLSVSVIFLCSNLIKKEHLKEFTLTLLFLKFIILFILFFLNNTGYNIIIKFLIMLDYVADVEIYASLYPMITLINKDNKVYALKGLIYSYANYAGIIFTSIFLGKNISMVNISFNSYCLIGSIPCFIAFLVLLSVDLKKYCKVSIENIQNNSLKQVVNIVKNDKITQHYLCYHISNNVSYACLNGMLITLLTSNLGFSATTASNFIIVLCIISILMGTLILEKLTLKNDYINFSIKFVGRLLLYFFAFIFNNKIMFLIAIIFMRALTDSYSHVSEAPYVNRFSSDNQLSFCNFREMIKYFSKAIGNFLCGIAISFGARYNFLFAFIFAIFQVIFGLTAISLRLKEKGVVNL